ncbi:3'-5' exonuclease [Rhodothermus profundi]|uniref:DNA polymerase-3 subunit epsilon n=1 Tax=Rhodothermus profundi TaxID=633813 RepID=A0A1M6P460_9BACT|nr:exonuclease domain-containing protein [Rhodothermus profundi]SHK02708.1 DNA polymerase-3 subunit epsilon [Rhodothermus profundi]
MMPFSRRFWKTYVVLALLGLSLLAAPNVIWWLSATPSERTWLLSRYPFLLVLVVLVLGGIYALWLHVYQTHVRPIKQLTDALHQVLAGHPLPPLTPATTPELKQLQEAVEELARRHRFQPSASSSSYAHHERKVLASLLGDLPEAVLVCRASGQILLYNEAARRLLESPEQPGTIGLGRSIFHCLDRELIAFVLDELAYQIRRPQPHPAVHFATFLPSGHFVQGRATPIQDPVHRLDTFVLLLRPLTPASRPLETIRGVDLLQALRRRLAQEAGVSLQLKGAAHAAWMRVCLPDAFELLYQLVYQLHQETSCTQLSARIASDNAQVHLWLQPLDGSFLHPKRVMDYVQADSFQTLLQTHQATLQVEDKTLHLVFPAAAPSHAGAARALLAGPLIINRPIYADFSLLETPATTPLDDRPLRSLLYTVFDTETTGLHPEQGDEIVAIGAVRIVGGRIRREETFDQLVNPRRPLSLNAVRVHGIQPALLQDKPSIEEVLPRFYRFAQDTVLVGHNVAFDLRFIREKEKTLAIRFEQPVLDTMLLAAVVDPERQHYGLDELAATFGIEPIGRHSALGDALITAELFLRLLPLLEQRGIHTLRQARAVSQQTRLARTRYGRIS